MITLLISLLHMLQEIFLSDGKEFLVDAETDKEYKECSQDRRETRKQDGTNVLATMSTHNSRCDWGAQQVAWKGECSLGSTSFVISCTE